MAGPVVVGPGESFNTGDVKSFPADSQHLYTAVAGNQAVIVWYTGTITGLKLHVVLYDRTVKDAVRYDFMNDALAAVPVGSLTGLLLNKNNQFLRWEYLPSPSP
jgi:hypothetical protein